MPGARESLPTGGTTRLPTRLSAAAIVAATAEPSAPAAMLSLAAIN
jgi:hypothetical protein